MTTPRAIADEIDNVLDYLVHEGLSIYRRPVEIDRGTVSWIPHDRRVGFLPHRAQHSVALYRHWLESGQFSAILFDASLLQITYAFAGPVLVAHRLAYVPAPATVDPDLLLEWPVFDVVEDALRRVESINFASTVRFEYDVAAAARSRPVGWWK